MQYCQLPLLYIFARGHSHAHKALYVIVNTPQVRCMCSGSDTGMTSELLETRLPA